MPNWDTNNAWRVFDNIGVRRIMSSGAMLTGHAWSGYDVLTFEIFQEMQHQGVESDDVFVSVS